MQVCWWEELFVPEAMAASCWLLDPVTQPAASMLNRRVRDVLIGGSEERSRGVIDTLGKDGSRLS